MNLKVTVSLTVVIAAIVIMLGSSRPAFDNVGSVYWQTNGGGCVPTDATIKNQEYWTVTKGGRVKYKGNGTDPLVFSCPITNINPNVQVSDLTDLVLFYQDPDGPGDDFQVKARLMSFAKSNGALKELLKVTSDKAGPWQISAASRSRSELRIDFTNYFYWVEVVISRTTASDLVVEFNGVSLTSSVT